MLNKSLIMLKKCTYNYDILSTCTFFNLHQTCHVTYMKHACHLPVICLLLLLHACYPYFDMHTTSLVPRPSEEGGGGIHCMRMRYIFRIIYRKVSVH